MMDQLLNREFLQTLLQVLAPISVLTFLLGLLVIPLIIGRLPASCFINIAVKNSSAPFSISVVLLGILRNIAGIFLFVAGIAMLFLPGQGILTILVSLLLLTFPGKQRILTYLICKPVIQQSLDWIRKKRGSPPFEWPDHDRAR